MDEKNWIKEQEDAKRDQDSNREIQKEGEEKYERAVLSSLTTSSSNNVIEGWSHD